MTPGPVGRALEARVEALELAVAELSRRLPQPAPEERQTVFGVPVVLAPGVSPEMVRAAVEGLPRGLAAPAALDALEAQNLLRRVTP